MMQSAQEAPQEVDASPKRFQDYLQEFLVTDSTWKAPKREKVDMAMKVVKQALPEALIADTTNQHVSPFVREFMLKDHTSLAALQTPDPQTPAIHNPSTQGIATPLERQGQQWFDPQAMQAQASQQAVEPFRNPPHHRQIASAETIAQAFDVNPQYTVAYNTPIPPPWKATNPTKAYKASISVTEVIKATGLGNYPAVLNGVFGYRGNVLTSQQLAERIQKATYEEKRTLQIARELNDILVANQNKGAYRNDAWATAQGIQCIASYNTYNGKLNLDNFRRDLAKFFIDQKDDFLLGVLSQHYLGSAESPLAESLMGRTRLLGYGWKQELQEKNSPNYNQAHHLAAYLGLATRWDWDPGEGAAILAGQLQDIGHPYDVKLSRIGVEIGTQLKKEQIKPSQLGSVIYERIRDSSHGK